MPMRLRCVWRAAFDCFAATFLAVLFDRARHRIERGNEGPSQTSQAYASRLTAHRRGGQLGSTGGGCTQGAHLSPVDTWHSYATAEWSERVDRPRHGFQRGLKFCPKRPWRSEKCRNCAHHADARPSPNQGPLGTHRNEVASPNVNLFDSVPILADPAKHVVGTVPIVAETGS